MFCTNCGHEVQGKFCTNCGAPVGEAAAPVAETPVYEAPQTQAPVYEAPQAPMYEAPDNTMYNSAPAQGQYAPPQQYTAPAYTAPDAKQKKPVSAGKIVLFVLLGLLALIIVLVAACSVLVGKGANDIEASLDDLSNIIAEESVVTESTDQADEYVFYEGLTYLMVDSATYAGDSVVANVTFWNQTDFGIDQISDLMVRLYDANGEAVATGNFFFDEVFDCGDVLYYDDYVEFTLTFDSSVGEVYNTTADLSECSTGYELMCLMYDDAGNVIGERVVTRMFELSFPAEWVGKVDYFMPDNAYGFYSIANDAAGADGTLFYIEYYEPGTYTGNGEYLGEDSWYEYYVTYPVGTPYDTSDAELSAEYELFQSQIDRVLYTVNIFE